MTQTNGNFVPEKDDLTRSKESKEKNRSVRSTPLTVQNPYAAPAATWYATLLLIFAKLERNPKYMQQKQKSTKGITTR